MEIIDLGLAWNWEYDEEFIYGIEHECRKIGISTYRIEMHNIHETLKILRRGKIRFRSFLDRASDEEESFLPIAKYFSRASAFMFNGYDRVEFAKDKAKMHIALLNYNVQIPYTIIISPYNKRKEVELSLTELAHLGRPFIIKPANTTGGGIGVVTGAETLKEILLARQHHKNDTYLLQETIHPEILGHRPAWFRAFYAFGKSIICWWDPETHIYKEVTPHDEEKYGLNEIHTTISRIYSACKLEFFSSEIAKAKDGRYVAVDYVNEICDMRSQHHHYDGVPNSVITKIQRQLAHFIATFL